MWHQTLAVSGASHWTSVDTLGQNERTGLLQRREQSFLCLLSASFLLNRCAQRHYGLVADQHINTRYWRVRYEPGYQRRKGGAGSLPFSSQQGLCHLAALLVFWLPTLPSALLLSTYLLTPHPWILLESVTDTCSHHRSAPKACIPQTHPLSLPLCVSSLALHLWDSGSFSSVSLFHSLSHARKND